jgi:hypothetical protein
MDKWSCSKHLKTDHVKNLCVRSKTGYSTLEECVSDCADKFSSNLLVDTLSSERLTIRDFEKKILEAINRLDKYERITSLPAELKSEILKNISSCTDLAQIRPILKLSWRELCDVAGIQGPCNAHTFPSQCSDIENKRTEDELRQMLRKLFARESRRERRLQLLPNVTP